MKLGHLIEATEAYGRATIIAPDETSEPFRKAAADARAENAALQRRVPSIRVTLGRETRHRSTTRWSSGAQSIARNRDGAKPRYPRDRGNP